MELIEIYADAAGETHFRRAEVDFDLREFAPPSQPLGVSATQAAASCLFLRAPPGWDRDFHPTPRKQLAVLLDGDITVGVTDGETVAIAPGTPFVLNDADSKGHLTLVQGDRDASFLFVALAEDGA